MNRKSVYDYFIGLLALMLSLIIVIDIFVSIPKEVRLSFYYIENIIRLIFIGDYIGRLVLSKNKKEFFKENIIDLLSIISIRIYLKCFKVVKITEIIPAYMVIRLCKVFMVIVNIIKFKVKVRDEIRKNKFNFLLVISVIIIVAPSLANFLQVAKPIPLEPPVTRAILPSNFIYFSFFLHI